VTIRRDDDLVGMGRLVGDDGCFYELVDIAVAPTTKTRGSAHGSSKRSSNM